MKFDLVQYICQNICQITEIEYTIIQTTTSYFYTLLDYVVHVFHEALRTGKYKMYLQPNTCLPMMYITDCLRGTIELLKCPADRLTVRTYNMQGVSFTPDELFDEIRKYIPHLEIEYEVDPMRQSIGKFIEYCLSDIF